MRGVHHQPLLVRLRNQLLKNISKVPSIAPSFVSSMNGVEFPVLRRQISPRTARAQNPEAGIDEDSIVIGILASPFAKPLLDEGFYFCPWFIRQIMPIL